MSNKQGRHLETLDQSGVLAANAVELTVSATPQEYTILVISVLSDVDIAIDLFWSLNASKYVRDPQQTIVHVGDPNGAFYERVVLGKYVKYQLENLTATDTTVFQIQTYARYGTVTPEEPLVLSNVGAGEEILIAPDEIKTLVSTDNSVTISTTANNEINLQTPPPLVLSNVGAGEEILIAPDEIKTLVSTDNSVTITTTANNEINLQSTGGPGTPSPFTVVSRRIEPANAANNLMMFSDPTANTLGVNQQENNSIISCDQCTINVFQNASFLSECAILTSRNCSIQNIQFEDTELFKAAIISSQDCDIIGSRSRNRLVAACENCYIQTGFGSGSSAPQVLLGSTNCQNSTDCLLNCSNINGPNLLNVSTQTTMISCINMGTTANPRRFGNRNVWLGCNNVQTGVNGGANSLIKAWNADLDNRSGCTILSDARTGGQSLQPSGNNQFVSRFTGGFYFYTNNNSTVGAELVQGNNGWAVVSDENKKENIVRLDNQQCATIREKLMSIDVCTYNFKENPAERICYGPTAQDWNSVFGCEDFTEPVFECVEIEPGICEDVPVLDENGDQVTVTKPAKDPLRIDQGDMIGILMATVKDLHNRIQELEQKVELLQQ